MQIYFIGLLKPKLQSYLFICLFFIMFWEKLGHRKAASSLVCHTVLSILYFCYFCLQKMGGKKENIYFMSVRSGSQSSVCLSRWGCSGFLSLPFFRPRGKPWYQYMEAITRKRDTVLTLPHMSEIQMTSIQCATELRITATAPLWGRSPPYCALVFFHLPAVSSRKHPAGREKHIPTLTSCFAPTAHKVIVVESCWGYKQKWQLSNHPNNHLAWMAANRLWIVWLVLEGLTWRNG